MRKLRPDVAATPGTPPGRFAYADPPYPGKAFLYADQPTFAGEVDHADLVVGLETRRRAGELLGYAISTSEDGLRVLLPLLPAGARICPWLKVRPIMPGGWGIANVVEYVLVVGGRPTTPSVPNFLVCPPDRERGRDLVGRKPPAFNAWLFALLGMQAGDELDDMFPGTGQVGRCWVESCRSPSPSAARRDDASTSATSRPSRDEDDVAPAGRRRHPLSTSSRQVA